MYLYLIDHWNNIILFNNNVVFLLFSNSYTNKSGKFEDENPLNCEASLVSTCDSSVEHPHAPDTGVVGDPHRTHRVVRHSRNLPTGQGEVTIGQVTCNSVFTH